MPFCANSADAVCVKIASALRCGTTLDQQVTISTRESFSCNVAALVDIDHPDQELGLPIVIKYSYSSLQVLPSHPARTSSWTLCCLSWALFILV